MSARSDGLMKVDRRRKGFVFVYCEYSGSYKSGIKIYLFLGYIHLKVSYLHLVQEIAVQEIAVQEVVVQEIAEKITLFEVSNKKKLLF